MKFKKKIIYIISASILLTTLFFLFSQIYAKYITSVSGSASIAISRWNITVNDIAIKSSSDISSKIIPIFPGNENIESNIIAPTAEGYFDLIFDFKDVDVSFEYNINVASDETSAVSDLVATGYSIDGGDKINFTDFNSPITEIINLNDNIDSRTIRVYVMWNDDPDTSSMNNIDDTASTLKSDNSAIFKVTISFTQIAE